MRIAWVDNAVAWGGVEVHLAMLARKAAEAGHEGFVFCDRALAARYSQVLDGSGVQLVPGPWNRILSPSSLLAMASHFRRIRPDVVHSHLYWSTRIAAPAAFLARVPRMVETIHLEENWRSGWRRILSFADGLLARWLVDRHIAVSEAVARSSRASRGIPVQRLASIPNAVPPEASRPSARTAGKIAFLGRLEHQKGLDVLLDALVLLGHRGVDFDVAIGGEGSLGSSLQARAETLGLAGRVRFVGRIDDRAGFLADRSILVLPSRYEGFPMVLLEASWHDQCVVASGVSGIPELIRDGETGFLCLPEDPRSLADALERAIGDDVLRRRCATGLLDRVRRNHDPDVFLRRTLEVLA